MIHLQRFDSFLSLTSVCTCAFGEEVICASAQGLLCNRDSYAIGRHISTPHTRRCKSFDSARLQFYTVGTSCSGVPRCVTDFTAEVNIPYNPRAVKPSARSDLNAPFIPKRRRLLPLPSHGPHLQLTRVRLCLS